MQFYKRYHQNSLSVNDPRMKRLQQAAEANNITVVMGYSERAGGSLYISQITIGSEGEIIGSRRKLKPTHAERTIFGEGNGSDVKVYDLPIGRLGALNCWEHYQPLTKYAMFSKHEQIHVASWPSLGNTFQKQGVYTFGIEANEAATRTYALESQAFVLCATAIISESGYELFCDTPEKEELLSLGGGWARIFGPDGRELASRLEHTEEGILYADIDLSEIHLAKAGLDPVGHYSRPDIFTLRFNENKTPWVEKVEEKKYTVSEEYTLTGGRINNEELGETEKKVEDTPQILTSMES
ncbi:carbon-nitrogen hydrolase family protein [Siminovitchia sediminis]|uniref:Carbon-nitrogen hydrolase family protein n=1 Tax=Siminovitchia sediminis TaxID=1274353 RepID=A0ABW4KJE9_9BACI